MKVQLSQICDAVKSTVPQEMWGEIIQKLDEAEQHSEALDIEEDAFDDSYDDPYDPTEFMDKDDEFDPHNAHCLRGDGDRCRCGRDARGDVKSGSPS